jgi:8-oxo-dGTP pyrophosphatase MutT (NUDIX family)/GNAT superfamily N-acetyltransferase
MEPIPPDAGGAHVLQRDGAFAVGLFEGDSMLSVAVALPARADDGRSVHNVAGLTHISSVVTHVDRWGEGLGGRVVRGILSAARRRGYARAQLWTQATNEPAQHLYEREGFQRSSRRKVDDFGEEIVHYVRDVPSPDPVYRPAARVLCFEPGGRLLLMHWRDQLDGHQLWEPPGGGIEAGETPYETVLREWHEETGLRAPDIDPEPTIVGRDAYWGGGRLVTDEWFFLGRIAAATDLAPAGLTAGERHEFLGWAWVRPDQLASIEDPVEPDLLPVLARLAAGQP